MKIKATLLSLLALIMCAAVSAQSFVGGRTDFRDETIYFAMTTRFYDGDPTNNVCGWDHQSVQIANNDPDWRGDFKGLIDKLDYIKALGFTAIWITPITQNASGTDFHGYHSMDFSTVDLRYESRTEWGASEDVTFQSLIDAAHAKGMKIILDIVLNHTGNFGEASLNPLFTRDQNIRNQASAATAVIPNTDKLGSDYNDLDGAKQYQARFKYFKNPDYDTHNYYHHYGTGWNWDLPNRWWGQIAGDCVDLNTENSAVSDYLVKCYGKFIEMGVDGFRIDTSGHISRLTFNHSFIPQFMALGEKYASKRLNSCPFYMFGEVCARFGSVIYRDQHNLSSHFYTWASESSLLSQWNEDATWWDEQYLKEGHDSPVGNMILCESETAFNHNSTNVFMQNGAWHEPDYSEASGFNVIDFPMHYNFNNAGSAIGIANQGDQYYNDASFNVVYVDSHDYCPGPNDGTRFNGGTAQWAENLSLMFTFRGIPCIYYGSEVEFKKGCKVDAGGTDMPVKESGRAYFGNYIEGTVTASDFGEYTASGNVQTTLNGDLAHHVRRLNMIRAKVPALRKGQYTFDGCSASGGYAFKRAYKDSYALVAINGGATFTNVPAGTYVDLVTGQSYQGGGTITVSAPSNQGQLRVLVKGWTGGKVGDDGKFMYTSSPVAHGGDVSFSDPGTTQYYTADDAVGQAHVDLSVAGGSFKTSTLSVTLTLSETATSGWYKIGESGTKTTFTKPATITLGADMSYGDSKTIYYGATGADGEGLTGSATYKKVDPNATITVYCKASTAPSLYVWDAASTSLNGAWPGTTMSGTTTYDGQTFYYTTFDADKINIIFSNSGASKTADITGITADVYYVYDGAGNATLYTGGGSQGGGSEGGSEGGDDPTTYYCYFKNTAGWSTVSVWAWNANNGNENCTSASGWPGETLTLGTDGYYKWTAKAGKTPTGIVFSNNGANQTSDLTFQNGKVYDATGAVSDYVEGGESGGEQGGDEPAEGSITVYCKASSVPNLYAWTTSSTGSAVDINGTWPGTAMANATTIGGVKFYYTTFQNVSTINIIFTSSTGSPQTANIEGITSDVYYVYDGNTTATKYTGSTDGSDAGTSSYCYFKNTAGWANVYAWAWNSDGECTAASQWPGDKLTIGADGYYKWSSLGGLKPDYIIFNAGMNMPQTENLTFQNGKVYDAKGNTSNYNGGTQTDPTTGDVVVYYDNANNWSSVYVYIYVNDGAEENSSWPGEPMAYKASLTVDGTTGWWTYVVPESLTYGQVLVNNGEGSQYPASGEAGLYLDGASKILRGTQWETYVEPVKPTELLRPNTVTEALTVYSIDGRRIRTNGTLKNLPRGLYIVNGKRYLAK